LKRPLKRPQYLDTVDFMRDTYKDDLKIKVGVLSDACAALYYGPSDGPPHDEQGYF
jgi:tRNA(adenine34) deaminase